MPYTTLNLSDVDLAEKIIAYQVGDLWVRRYDFGETDFTTS